MLGESGVSEVPAMVIVPSVGTGTHTGPTHTVQAPPGV